MDTHTLQDWDRQFVWHPFTHMRQWMDESPLVIVRGEGCELIDSDGKRYIDGVASLWCNVHGHQVPVIDQAIKDQLGKIAHSTLLGLTNEPAVVLARKLIDIAPAGLQKVFYGSDGASATEVAFKIAVQYWWNLGQKQKTEFIGLTEAYHGDTVGAMSVGHSSAFHKPYMPLLFKVHYTPAPFEYRGLSAIECLRQMEQTLVEHHTTIAAICIEPIVMGAAGMIVHPEGFLRGVRELATKYNVLLICDEVATGFGRTGKMFACEHENVSPDILCLGKGLTGGYLPLSATLTTQKIFDAFLGAPAEGKTLFHGHTFTGNPICCAAAIASIELFEKNDLMRIAQERSCELAGFLRSIADHQYVGNIRQKGLMVGIELVADKASKKPFDPTERVGAMVCKQLRDHGILIRPLGDTLVIMPPLAISTEQLKRIVDAIQVEINKLGAIQSVQDRGDDVIAGDY